MQVTELGRATIAGDLNQALALVKNRPISEVQEMMLRAGFSTTGMHNKRQFWQEVQSNLARACQARKDGWGMR